MEQQVQEQEEEQETNSFPISQIAINVMAILNKMLPYLEDNLGVATAVYNAGKMSEIDYGYILARNRDANIAVSSIDFDKKVLVDSSISKLPNYEDRLLGISAWCIIDLRDHITLDLKGDAQKEALALMGELVELLKYAGYTKNHPMYKIPMK
jgi:hypothetical protein